MRGLFIFLAMGLGVLLGMLVAHSLSPVLLSRLTESTVMQAYYGLIVFFGAAVVGNLRLYAEGESPIASLAFLVGVAGLCTFFTPAAIMAL